MKILYITTKATYGGVQTHIKQCAKYMLDKGNNVAVMAHPNGGNGLEGELKKLGISFYPNKFLRNSFNPINGIFAVIQIRKVIKKIKPDLISCHSSVAGFWGRLAVMNKIPVVFTAHGWGFTEGTSFMRANIIKLLEKNVAPLCKKIICVSDNDRDIAIKYKITNSQKLVTIHNGTDCNINIKLIGKYDNNFFDKTKIPIVYIGRLSNPKRPEDLILAFSKLPILIQNKACIYIIGDGEKKEMICNDIKKYSFSNKVNLIGSLPHEQVIEFLSSCSNINNSCSIFSLISDYEGFPRSIIEAMSCGFAIIASDVGGVHEAINKDVGIMVKRRDINGLQNTLELLLENPEKITQLGKNAKIRAKNEFSLERMLTETEKVYKSIVSNV